MVENARRHLDAVEILMQDHRELDSLLREFDHLRQQRKDTGLVIASTFAELKMHDTLETSVFYAAVDEATDDEAIQAFLDDAEDEHDEILESIEEIEQTRADAGLRNERFAGLAERVTQHLLREEAELFPLLRTLKQVDLDAIATAMKKRRVELTPETGSTDAYQETT